MRADGCRGWSAEAQYGYLAAALQGLGVATSAGRLGVSFGVPAVTGEGTVPAASPDGMLGQGVSEKQLQIRAHSELMHIRKVPSAFGLAILYFC